MAAISARLRLARACVAALLFGTTMAGSGTSDAANEPPATGGPATFRRLNEAQYTRAVEETFGSGIKVPGRFEPPLREEGLLAVGDGKVVISPSGFEQFELRAREISAQVLAEGRRKTFLTCAPPNPASFDQACAGDFLGKYGRQLFRRPLADDELASFLATARATTTTTGNFYKGLEAGMARLLISPNFLFRVESSQPEAAGGAVQRLDDYSLATRISFLLWDAPPDAELMAAAATGALRDQQGLERQVDRMIASPRFEQGVRAFFSDMFAYDQFEGLSKDQAIYPKFTSPLVKDAREQVLRTIVDVLVTNRGDYRDLFTTRKTFMSRNLGSLYKVQVPEAGFGGWTPHTFGPTDPRAGILTLAGFLMLDPTHEGRSSPTIRGKSVRELFLCQKVPAPPGNVDFKIVQDTSNPVYKTARERLLAHRDNPTCAGCHAITDPMGLAMENYDAIGDFRTQENGAPIDASGKFEGKPYRNLIELEKVLHDSPAIASCVVQRTYEYGVGRPVTAGERDWLKYASQRFADDKYRFPALMRRIATSRVFQTVSTESVAAGR
jgi:hypothetical protein